MDPDVFVSFVFLGILLFYNSYVLFDMKLVLHDVLYYISLEINWSSIFRMTNN